MQQEIFNWNELACGEEYGKERNWKISVLEWSTLFQSYLNLMQKKSLIERS
jgi:hypothetical protein